MSIRNIEASKIAPRKLSNRNSIPTGIPFNWIRNKAWPTLTEPSSSEEKLVGLYAVFPGDGTGTGGNWFAVTFSGNYTVNFGDGTIENKNSAVAAYKSYDFSNGNLYDATVEFTGAGNLVIRNSHGYINGDTVNFYRISSTTGISEGQTYYVINATADNFQISLTDGGSAVTLTADGSASLLPYKIATVTITPQQGQNLTSVNLSTKHNQIGLTNGYATGWLDIALSVPNATSITVSSNVTRHANLEIFNLIASSNFTSCSNWFNNCYRLQKNIISFDATSSVTDMSYMFNNCSSLTYIPLLNTSSVTNMSYMFNNCNSLTSIPLLNTSSVTDMSSMFSNCYSLTSIPLLNTSSVTDMSSMFSICSSLTSIPLLNTSSVTDMSYMFSNCNSLTSIPLLNTSSVTSMIFMFNDCYSLTSIPLLNTSSVTDMKYMFDKCYSLTSIPLLNTSSVTSMLLMFSNCYSLTSIPLLDTSSVTNMRYMFDKCYSLTSVPAFNLSSVTAYTLLFNQCFSLSRIEAAEFNNTFSVADCNLSSAALDEIYGNLSTLTGPTQTIVVSGNYGVAGDNPSIAINKGWTVTG